MTDLYLILFFGVVGHIFDKVDIPITPLVLSRVATCVTPGAPQLSSRR
jgi:TctA family transporter